MKLEVSYNPDRMEWDDYVSSSPHGHFMQSHAWGVFQGRSGWEPHYLHWRDGNGIRAAVLLLARKIPMLPARIFYAPRGPIIDSSSIGTSASVEEDLRAYLAKEKGIFLRADPYIVEADCNAEQAVLPDMVRVPRDWSYWNAPRLVLWLDLNAEEDTVFKRMTATCRNEVRRGYKNGVEYSQGTAAGLDDFFRVMTLTGQHKGIAVHNLDYYRQLFSLVSASAHVQLFLGRFQGAVVTAGVSIKYGKKAWLLYAGSTPDSYKLRANRTLQWEMIKWAHSEGCERYDFRGTATNDPPRPEDPGYGVYEFKKSFGPEYVRLVGYYDLVASPFGHRVFRFVEEKLLPIAYRMRTWIE